MPVIPLASWPEKIEYVRLNIQKWVWKKNFYWSYEHFLRMEALAKGEVIMGTEALL